MAKHNNLHICIIDQSCHFNLVVFISSYKRCGLFLYNYKMVERSDDSRAWRANLARGQARMLIEALEAVENRRESQEHVLVGRAGVTPRNWMGAQRNEEGMTMCSRQEVSQIPQ